MMPVVQSARLLRRVAEFERELSSHFNKKVVLSWSLDDNDAGLEPSDIVNSVAARGSVSAKLIMSSSQEGKAVKMRSICYYFMYERLLMSKKEIGRYFGRDHSTVINGLNTFNDLHATSEEFRCLVDDIRELL